MLNGDKVYRYDQNKTLTWLAKKIQLLAQTLKEESVYVGSGYCNTAYMNQTTTQSTEEEYLHYACGMVQDYVPPLIADLLDEKYHKVKQQVEENPPSAKKPKIGISEPLEDYSNKTDHHHIMSVKTIPKLSAAQKALTKVNKKGMQKMTSFFTSKS
jgi:ribonuclease H2 subunit B